mmetsp:Transcript_18496/g.54844  ORF Transcript_18496/g.54844 Transcript_18496/m.54844 type:complete len:499 (-) Transcript_18496:31-1527(-)
MFPMLPTFHIIGNVTQATDGDIKLEPINDASGVTFYGGVYHVWHQCCQNHWDHIVSRDLIHWQRLPPPIQPLTERTYDGSISILPMADGGPIFLYDAPDKVPHGWPGCGECILSIARLNDTNDKYLKTFTRDPLGNPVQLELNGVKPPAFPSTIWKNGDHWNFVDQGSRFTTKDKTFRKWDNADTNFLGGGCRENGGQWWIPTPNQVGGGANPPGTPNQIVNCGGGNVYRMGNYFAENESFVPTGAPNANLEHGNTGWWGAQGGPANNNRMMMIGWVRDFHGDAGPGITFLTRLSLLREVNWDVKTASLVANPVPELSGLRTEVIASETVPSIPSGELHLVNGTGGGVAASADVNITFTANLANASFGACVLNDGTSTGGIGIAIQSDSGGGSGGARTFKANVGLCHNVQENLGVPFTVFGDENEITVRILPDRSVADFFVQGGRFSATEGWIEAAPRKPEDSNVIVWADTPAVGAKIEVHAMGCGWLNPSYTENPTL